MARAKMAYVYKYYDLELALYDKIGEVHFNLGEIKESMQCHKRYFS